MKMSSYILTPVDIDINTLIPLNNKSLGFKEAMVNLFAGQILIIKDYEATTGADTYLKLALELDYPRTKITYTNPANSATFWQDYPVPIDTLSLNTVYLYDKGSYEFDSIYRPNDVIKYTDTSNHLVAGVVKAVYRDTAGHVYYQFTNNEQLYQLQQSGQGVHGEASDGHEPFIPVADITKDSNSVIVQDNRDRIVVQR